MNEAAMSTVLEIGSRWKPYPTYKDAGVEWLEEIPTHWKIAPLKREFEVQLGKMLQNEPSSSGDTLEPYLRAANITWQGVDLSDIKEMWFSPGEKQKYTLKIGDLLVSEGGDVGRSALWRGELPHCYIQNAINRVRGNGLSTTRFLFYWMYTLKEHGYIAMLCNKATISHFTAEKVQEVPVMFPPPSEQRTITSFLDHETAHIDTLIAKKERLIELLTEKHAALISHVVAKGLDPTVPMKDSGVEWLGEIPGHWKCYSLRRVIRSMCDGPFGSDMKSSHYSDEGIRLIRLQNIGQGYFDDSDKAYVPEEHFAALPGHDAKPGDLIVAGLGDQNHPVGRACLVPDSVDRAMVKADCFRVRLDEKHLLHVFAMLFLCSSIARIGVAEQMRGATRDRMNLTGLAQLCVIVPPLKEQSAIATYLYHETAQIDALITKVRDHIEKLREYRIALISAAVTGKIDVRGEAV